MCCFATNLLLSSLVKEFIKLVNIWQSYGQNGRLFYALHSPCAFFPQICRTRHESRVTCVWQTKTVTNYCYVNKQIHLTLLSTEMKILQTSFDILHCNRLRATDRNSDCWSCKAFCCDIFFFVAEAVYRGSCNFWYGRCKHFSVRE